MVWGRTPMASPPYETAGVCGDAQQQQQPQEDPTHGLWINRHNTPPPCDGSPPVPASVLENQPLCAFTTDLEAPTRPREHSPEARNHHGPRRPLQDFASGMLRALDRMNDPTEGGSTPAATATLHQPAFPSIVAVAPPRPAPLLSVAQPTPGAAQPCINAYPPVLCAEGRGGGGSAQRACGKREREAAAMWPRHTPPTDIDGTPAAANRGGGYRGHVVSGSSGGGDALHTPTTTALHAVSSRLAVGTGTPGAFKRRFGASASPSPLDASIGDGEDDDTEGSDMDADCEGFDEPLLKRAKQSVRALTARLDSAAASTRLPYTRDASRAVFEKYCRMSNEAMRGQFESPHDAAQRYISGEGLHALLADLGWAAHPSPGVPCFLFLLGTRYLHLVSEAELDAAFQALQTAHLPSAVRLCQYLHTAMLQDTHMFQQYFSYAFHFFKPVGQKRLDRATAQRLLLLMCPTFTFTSTFAHYLDVSDEKSLTFDQWKNFLHFCAEISPSCGNYSDFDAWPTLYDGYVEWLRSTQAMAHPHVLPPADNQGTPSKKPRLQ